MSISKINFFPKYLLLSILTSSQSNSCIVIYPINDWRFPVNVIITMFYHSFLVVCSSVQRRMHYNPCIKFYNILFRIVRESIFLSFNPIELIQKNESLTFCTLIFFNFSDTMRIRDGKPFDLIFLFISCGGLMSCNMVFFIYKCF